MVSAHEGGRPAEGSVCAGSSISKPLGGLVYQPQQDCNHHSDVAYALCGSVRVHNVYFSSY